MSLLKTLDELERSSNEARTEWCGREDLRPVVLSVHETKELIQAIRKMREALKFYADKGLLERNQALTCLKELGLE